MNGDTSRRVLDVSGLPDVALGSRNVSWLGNVLYMTIEGTMFALLVGTYFFLRTRTVHWPPAPQIPPALRYGLISGAVFLLSIIPAWWTKRKAFKFNREKVQLGLAILAGFGVVVLVVRVLEFSTLNCQWSDNAYASILWVLLGLHTGHLITEWFETLAVLGISFTSQLHGIRFADVGMNSDYWYFVVVTGIVIDIMIYGVPRWI